MPYPSIVGSFTNPLAANKLNSPSHSSIETAQNTALTEIETFVGTLSSVAGTLIYDVRATASNGGGHVQTVNKGGTGQTGYAKGDLLVASSGSVLSKLTVGANGQALVADDTQSVGIKWGATAVRGVVATDFATSNRYTYSSVNGTMTFGTSGALMGTSGTASSMGQLQWKVGDQTNFNIFNGGGIFSAAFAVNNFSGSGGQAFLGLGLSSVSGAGHVFSKEHMGFKVVVTNGTASIYATNADGVTEKATALTGLTTADQVEVLLQINSASSVDYSYRKNGGSIATTVNHILNIPSVATNLAGFSVTNSGTATDISMAVTGATFQR